MPTITANNLEAVCRRIADARGSRPAEAQQVAANRVTAPALASRERGPVAPGTTL